MSATCSAEWVALTAQLTLRNTVSYKNAPPIWSWGSAELVAVSTILPPSWSRFSAELVAPYIEQNTTEHSLQNILQN